MKQQLTVFFLIIFSLKGICQTTDSSFVDKIDFLNIEGKFRKASWGGDDLYYDMNDSLIGIFFMGVIGICGDDKDIDVEQVFICGKKIIYAEHIEFAKKKLVSIYTNTDTLYFNMQPIPITDFLQENTMNATLVPLNEIRIHGKRVTMYHEHKYVKRINIRGKRIYIQKLAKRYRYKKQQTES